MVQRPLCFFLRGAQLVLRSSVLTVLDLYEVNVRWRMLRSSGWCCLEEVDLLMTGTSAAKVLLVPHSCPLPLLITHPPSLAVCCILVFAKMGATSTASGRLEIICFCLEDGVERATLVILISAVSGI